MTGLPRILIVNAIFNYSMELGTAGLNDGLLSRIKSKMIPVFQP